MEEKPDIHLFLENKKDIDKIKTRVEDLMKSDMGLSHKMDLVIKAQEKMDEGFGHSRKTGHDTWQAVQKISGDIGQMVMTIQQHSEKIFDHGESIKRGDKRFERYILGVLIVVVGTLLVSYVRMSGGG